MTPIGTVITKCCRSETIIKLNITPRLSIPSHEKNLGVLNVLSHNHIYLVLRLALCAERNTIEIYLMLENEGSCLPFVAYNILLAKSTRKGCHVFILNAHFLIPIVHS